MAHGKNITPGSLFPDDGGEVLARHKQASGLT